MKQLTVQTPRQEQRGISIRRERVQADFQVEARRLERRFGYLLISTPDYISRDIEITQGWDEFST
jgi:hypothetical protein